MTGGQDSLLLDSEQEEGSSGMSSQQRRIPDKRAPLRVLRASPAEQEAHDAILENMGAACLWLDKAVSSE